MAIPRIITITGTALGVDGTPVPGVRVVFTPNLATPNGESVTDDFMVPEVIAATSDAAGEISVQVPATDDPDFTTTGWTWNLTVTYPGVAVGLNYDVAIPYASPGQTLKLWELIPVPGDAGSVLYATVAMLAGYLPLTGGTVAGNLAVSNVGNSKSYRFRVTGAKLDNEAAGADWIMSVWSGANYTGTQYTYIRFESGVQLGHLAGRWVVAANVDTGTFVLDADPTAGTVKTGSKNGLAGIPWAGRKDTVGPPITGTWAVDDMVASTTGFHRCTVAGTPGTWVSAPIGAPSERSNVATNMWGFGNGTASIEAGTSRSRHVVVVAGTDFQLVYGGWYSTGGNTDAAQPSTIPIRATIELAGTLIPVTFNGALNGTIEPGGRLVSDPFGFDLTANSTMYVRTWTSSTNWYGNTHSRATSGSGGFASGDLTPIGSGAVADSVHALLAPMAILARRAVQGPSVAVVGDSISVGVGDLTASGGGGEYGAFGTGGAIGGGLYSRALTAALIPMIGIGQSGATSSQFANSFFRKWRSSLMAGCTHALAGYGVNDVNNGIAAATIKTNLVTGWLSLRNRGLPTWQSTVTPITTSTDAWATTGNQTIWDATKSAVRIEVNDWIRDGAPLLNNVPQAIGSVTAGVVRAGAFPHPLAGYSELADLAETARNSGIWRALYTSDGVHPNAVGAAALALGVPVTSLRV
jgi:lysophospholipase L1-like esterase